MAFYLCELQGENFAFSNDEDAGGYTLLGFYTNRLIEADTAERAERIAINKIRNDHRLLQTVLKLEHGPHPVVKVTGLYELPEEPIIQLSEEYTLFPMPPMELAQSA